MYICVCVCVYMCVCICVCSAGNNSWPIQLAKGCESPIVNT